MDKKEVLEWMDKQIEIVHQMRKYDRIDDIVCYITSPLSINIQVSNALKLGKMADIEVSTHERSDGEYPIEVRFLYKGEIFYSIHKRGELDNEDD